MSDFKEAATTAQPADYLTVLRHPLPCAKTWKADGTIQPHASAKFYTRENWPLHGPADFQAAAVRLASDPHALVVRGRYVGDARAQAADPEYQPGKVRASKDYFEDRPHHCATADVDGADIPAGLDLLRDPEACVRAYRARLPPPWAVASCWWRLSSSAGHPSKPTNKLRVHMGFWLSTPATSAQLRQYIGAGGFPGVDLRLFQPTQLHFTAAPIIEAPQRDPFEGRRMGVLPGLTDGVLLPPLPDAPAQPAPRAIMPSEGPSPEWNGPTDDVGLFLAMRASRRHDSEDTLHVTDYLDRNILALRSKYPGDGPDGLDESRVDAGAFAHLAFWTGRDAARMERLARQTKLVREKWDSRPDYLQRTISKACSLCAQVYGEGHVRADVSAPITTQVQTVAPERGNGRVPADLPHLGGALEGTEGLSIRFDRFKQDVIIRWADHRGLDAARVIESDDYLLLREHFQKAGFKPIGRDLMADAVRLVARRNEFDSAQDWLAGLQWDGVPRVDLFAAMYLGAASDDYARAVGRYLWTAAAGRVIEPGVKADAAPVLLGAQGAGKSSAIAALAPADDVFGELSLDAEPADIARRMQGKLIVECPELAGMHRAENERVKALLTCRIDEWTPKYQETPRRAPRRCIFVGSSNEPEFLSDPTGNRRWLPLQVGLIDLDGLKRDRDQLWAEGAVLFRKAGVAHRDLADLAPSRVAAHVAEDPWDTAVAAWLASRRGQPVTAHQVLSEALSLPPAQRTTVFSRRVGHCIRKAGWTKKTFRDGERTGSRFVYGG